MAAGEAPAGAGRAGGRAGAAGKGGGEHSGPAWCGVAWVGPCAHSLQSDPSLTSCTVSMAVTSWCHFHEGPVGGRLLKHGFRLQVWAHLFQLAKCRHPEKIPYVRVCCGSFLGTGCGGTSEQVVGGRHA